MFQIFHNLITLLWTHFKCWKETISLSLLCFGISTICWRTALKGTGTIITVSWTGIRTPFTSPERASWSFVFPFSCLPYSKCTYTINSEMLFQWYSWINVTCFPLNHSDKLHLSQREGGKSFRVQRWTAGSIWEIKVEKGNTYKEKDKRAVKDGSVTMLDTTDKLGNILLTDALSLHETVNYDYFLDWIIFKGCSRQAVFVRESIQASHMSGRQNRESWEQAADGELQRNRQIKAP